MMRNRARAALAALAAAASLAAFASTASANDLLGNEVEMYFDWEELTFEAGGFEVTCPVTFLNDLHSLFIEKTYGLLVGFVDHAQVAAAECAGGGLTFQAGTLPWHLTYKSFTGTLPTPTQVTFLLRRMGFTVSSGGITCLGVTDAADSMDLILDLNPEGRVLSVTVDPDFVINIDDVGGGFLCDMVGTVRAFGTGAVERGAGQPYFIDLI